eukprot:SAG31_NODE_639_length_13309_cov_4.008468_14_plen_90_part_00
MLTTCHGLGAAEPPARGIPGGAGFRIADRSSDGARARDPPITSVHRVGTEVAPVCRRLAECARRRSAQLRQPGGATGTSGAEGAGASRF